MGRILALDYGTVRVGVAVTDPLQIIANGLDTVPSSKIIDFLKEYVKKENVETIVVGEPKHMDNTPAQNAEATQKFISLLEQTFPGLPIHTIDERLTSKMAFQAMIDGGMKKKDRRNKAMIDKLSATIILQTFMEMQKNGTIKGKQ